MSNEGQESGMRVSDDQRPLFLTEEQLKTLRAPLIEAAKYSAEIGLEIEPFLAECKGIFESFAKPQKDEEEQDEETSGDEF